MLKYIGDGSALPGLPARDVSEAEILASGYTLKEILASGLYQSIDAGKPARKEK